MKKFALGAILIALPLCAQRHASPHAASPARSVGHFSARPVGHWSGGGNGGGVPIVSAASYGGPLAYPGTFMAPLGVGVPVAYAVNPFPDSGNGGGQAIVVQNVPEPEQKVVYIPSYMRPSNGPSLAEIASKLKADKKPATLIWKNVDPIIPSKPE